MPPTPCSAAIFDVASTLALVQLTPAGEQIQSIEVYPDAANIVRELREEGVRVRLLLECEAAPEDQVREKLLATELHEFAEQLQVFSRGEKIQDALESTAALVRHEEGCDEATLLFVGGDAMDRAIASRMGFLTAPHPVLAVGMLRGGGPLLYLRILPPAESAWAEWIHVLHEQPVVPFHATVEAATDGLVTIFAIADTRTAGMLDKLGLRVDRLSEPGEPEWTAPYLIQDDLLDQHGFRGTAPIGLETGPALRVLASPQLGIVAVSGGTSVESFHFNERSEGHTRTLSSSLNWLRRPGIVAPRDKSLRDAANETPLSGDEKAILRQHFTPVSMASAVARYVAAGSDGTGTVFGSRHFKHPGNKLAVDMVADDLKQMASASFRVDRPCFRHNGVNGNSVVATLQSSPGMEDKGVVFVCAHLDTISDTPDPETDQAPGGDDDASGMAAVLVAARAMVDLALLGTPHREIRFALFNCEEVGMTGSHTYARAQANLSIPVAAMFQVDMIGYAHEEASVVEVHAGFSPQRLPNAADAATRSLEQAKLVSHLRYAITNLTRTDILSSPNGCGATSSDHVMFHAAGYPACLVSEQLFRDERPCMARNPAWHKKSDTRIDEHHAAEIARLVAAAAWIAATR